MLSSIANYFTMPLLYPFLLILSGVYFVFSFKLLKAKCCLIAGLFLLFLFTQPLVATLVVRPLENAAVVKPFDTTLNSTIVVMACNYRHELAIPFESRWTKCSTDRLLRAIDIYQRTGDNIIVAGGNFGDWPNAYSHYATIFLTEFGVNPKHIIAVPSGYDSESEIQAILSQLSTPAVTLVTSASHMNRAQFFFKLCGKKIETAPTNYLSLPSSTLALSLPSSESLTIIKRALHEYLGTVEQVIKKELGLFKGYCG